MLKGHVFKFQTFANEAFAHFIDTFLQGNMGVTKGCNLSKTSNSVTIGAGYFCVMGRFLEIVGNETISNITNTGYYQLICEIDLTKTNTSSELNQAVIKLIRNTSAYSNLTKEDLFNGGTLYQYEFARFKVTEQGIIDFSDRRTFLNLTSLYSQINSNFNTLFNTKDQQAEALLEEIREELASVEDGSAYLLKTGGNMTGDLTIQGKNVATEEYADTKVSKSGDTMTGDLNFSGNKVKFSNNGGIEWKESGYGDKFRIIPDFSGADDNNILKLQGAVGAAGEDPAFQDLGSFSAKSGNANIKGTMTAANHAGKINGFEWDINTANTSDTWFLVMNGTKIQHRAMNTIIPAIAVLTGNITTPEAGSSILTGTTEISYPAGFTRRNSVVVSIMGHPVDQGDDIWATPLRATSVTSTMYGNGDLYAVLMSNKIRICTNKNDTAMPRRDVTFKLVLMKIS